MLGWFYPREFSRRTTNRLAVLTGVATGILFLTEFASVSFGIVLLIVAPASFGSGYFSTGVGSEPPTESLPSLRGPIFWILIGGILGLAFYVRVRGIGDFGLRLDERYHLEAALGYLKSGEFRLWRFTSQSVGGFYRRASLYTWQVAMMFRLTAVKPGYGRLVSLGWGMLLFAPIGWIGWKLNLKRFWFCWLTLVLGFFPYAITISRWMRFYAMFNVLFLFLTVLVFGLLSEDRTARRLIYGMFAIGVLLTGVVFRMATLTFSSIALVVAVAGYLFTEEIVADRRNFADLKWPGIVLGGLGGFVLIGIYLFEQTLFQETFGNLWVNWNYPVLLYRDLFGYGFGSVALMVTIATTRRTAFERYLWWIIGLAVLVLMGTSDRIIQYRYAGHLTLLVLPLFALALQRLYSRLSSDGWVLVSLAVVLVALVSPVKDLGDRLQYIREGNMGYVHFQGDRAPQYRPVLNHLKRYLGEDDHVVTIQFYGKYLRELRQTGASVDNRSSVKAPVLEKTLRLPEEETTPKRQWFIVPLHARQSFSESYFNRLAGEFTLIWKPEDYGMYVFYRKLDSTEQTS